MFIADRQRAGRVWRHVQPPFVHWCWRCRIVGYSIVYDLAGIVISNRTYSASDGDTSGYSDGITELSQAARACEYCASGAEMAWRIDTLFIF